jgi:Ion transport protein
MIYTIIITPFRVSFFDVDSYEWYCIDLAVDFLFLFDVIVNSISAFYTENNDLVMSHKDIFLNYLKSWMIIDIFTSLPFTLIFAGGYSSLSRLGRLPKIYRLIKIAKLIRVVKFLKNKGKLMKLLECFSKISIGFEKLLYFFLIFIGLVHIVSCIWFFLSKFATNNINWVTKYQIQDLDIQTQYLCSFYWTITTLTTVGYGDITPANNNEMIFCTFVMLGGVFFIHIPLELLLLL